VANKQERLSGLNEKWIKNCPCKLRSSATQAVPGEGSADADIMFIGEAPGRSEDVHGIPFVGAAGKFLNEMLGEIKKTREDVYITNIVKYRPPANRDPHPNEVEECWPWLIAQINIVQPKLIVFLGRHALNRFFPGEQISKAHGKFLKKKPTHVHKEQHKTEPEQQAEIKEEINNDLYSKVLEVIKKEKRITQKSLRKQFPLSEAKISLVITELEAKGKIEKIKKGRGNLLIFKE